jgi:putative peptidoglycan lipid II flippase
LPAAFSFLMIAHPIIAVLFERGSFTAFDTEAVTPALMAFALGLPAYVLVKVLTPGFFARHDTKTPVKIALVSLAVNVGLNLALMRPLAHVGMALSTALAAWLNVGLLAWTLKRRGYFAIDHRLTDRLWRIFAACLVMAGVLWAGERLLAPMLAAPGLRLFALVVLIGLGGLTFVVAGMSMGAVRLSELKAMARRRKS